MIEAEHSPVLVRGVGDVGSAVAAVLFRAGYAVALHDAPAPAAPRRGMAFADAVFDGAAVLDGLTALRVDTAAELHGLDPIVVSPAAKLINRSAAGHPCRARNGRTG